MKRYLLTMWLVVLGLLLVSMTGWAAQNEPGEHPKKVYVDPQTHAIYWPKSLPFYLRLATGPEKDAQSFLLQNVFSRDSDKKITPAESGVQLDMSGRQFIRWYNSLTRDSILFVFYSDGDAPVVSLNLGGAPSYQSSQQLIYGAGLKASFAAKDNLSGVQDIFVAIDDASFEPYKAPFSFTQERPYRIRAYAVDRVGNTSQVISKSFTVDLTPPKTEHNILAHAIGTILSPQSTIALHASDSPAGVQYIYFKFDSSQTYSVYGDQPIRVNKLASGPHALTYYAVDHVGNKEDTTVFRFYLDKKAPRINTFVLGDQSLQKTTLYVSPRSKIKFEAEDNKIGVNTIEYALNKGSYQKYTGPFALSPEHKIYSMMYRVKDKLGNVSADGHLLFKMDALPPQSSLRFDGPNFEQRGRFWISSKTKIVLSAKDTGSGVQGIKIQLGDDPESPYEKPFSLKKEGRYALHFFAVDRVNNAERPHTIALIVDNTPPKIVMNFSSAPIAGADTDSGDVVYPLDTSLFLGSTDASSGAAGVWFSLNGTREKQYRSPLTFKKAGTYEISVRTVDRVGNQTVKKVRFGIQE